MGETQALAPELSRDYDERTSITTLREVFTVIGYILGAATTTMVAILVTAFGVREKTRDIESAKIPAFKAVIATFRNKPFMWLMGCFLLTSLSFTLLTALLPYYLTYQLEMTKE